MHISGIGRVALSLVLLASVGGCAFQTEQQINAELARHIGEPETDLVRDMGVPTRSYQSGGHRFLAYYKGEQQIDSFNGGFGGPGGGGFGYGGYGGGFGYGGWGGWGFGGFSQGTIYPYGCDTTFEVADSRVIGFKRHGNAC